MHRHITYLHNQLHGSHSTSAFPQINFSVVVHGRMQDLPTVVNFFGCSRRVHGVAKRLLGGSGHASPIKKI